MNSEIGRSELAGMSTAEAYINLIDSSGSDQRRRALLGHAVVAQVDDFESFTDYMTEDSSGKLVSRYSACGFQFHGGDNGFVLEHPRAVPLVGVVLEALSQLFPNHSSALASSQWSNEQMKVEHFGMHFEDLFRHPYTRSMLGFDTRSDPIQYRIKLRSAVLSIAQSKDLAGDQRWLYVCSRNCGKLLRDRVNELFNHYMKSVEKTDVIEALGPEAKGVLFVNDHEISDDNLYGRQTLYPHRRLVFLESYPAFMPVLGSSRPTNLVLQKLRLAVDTSPSASTIEETVEKAIGADLWKYAKSDPTAFLLEDHD